MITQPMNSSILLVRANARAPRPFLSTIRGRNGGDPAPNGAAPTIAVPAMTTTVGALLASGKGLLAADESLPTIERRFHDAEVPFTEENRKIYRELLFTTPGLGEFISGAILHDETLRQRTSRGVPLSDMLAAQGIVPGIKVDKGTMALPGFAGEKITQGLDGLRERLVEYRQLGARFTKWRAVIGIGKRLPTTAGIEENARALASFATLSQEAGLVPMVEPEVLFDGGHTIERCEEVTTATLRSVFAALVDHGVVLEAILLKTGMVLPGRDCAQQVAEGKVAEATLRCLRRAVPAAVPGIVFLSGGQGDVAATERLDTICRMGGVPWKLSFSFGRGLQEAALKTWKGSPDNVAAAQAALRLRAMCNSLAVQGKY
jgi:fructose-bisphosphate aldolase class I